MKKVEIIVNYNLYESKRYFGKKLAEAFRRKGIEAVLTDSTVFNGPTLQGGILPDFTCSFNRMVCDPKGRYLWDYSPVPHVSFLVDPVIYNEEVVFSKLSIGSCVDLAELREYQARGADKLFFMPHAVEKDLEGDPADERPFDLVFIGSCYDPEYLKIFWRKNLPASLAEVIELGIEKSFSSLPLNFLDAARLAVKEKGIEVDPVFFFKIAYFIDNYMRGYDRLQLIRSIKNVDVHVFGGTCWREERPIKGWNYYLGGQSNVTLHPAIEFSESMEILKKSKICLNSVPSYREGTHERVFASLATGCLPITSENLYLQREFKAGEEIGFYAFNARDQVEPLILSLLDDPKKRIEMVKAGRQKVMQSHTWDQRVDLLTTVLPPLFIKHAEGIRT